MNNVGRPREIIDTEKPPDKAEGKSAGRKALFRRLILILPLFLLIIVIIGTNFIAYGPGGRSLCSYAEEDAKNVLAALASYFSEPGNMRIPSIATLQSVEGLSLNNENPVPTIWPPEGSNLYSAPATFQVTVFDNPNRCPLGSTFTATIDGTIRIWE